MKGKWGEDGDILAQSLWIQREEGDGEGGTDSEGEQTVLMLVFRVVYLTLCNTFCLCSFSSYMCVRVCVCLVASHWETGISVKGKGCP